MRQLIADGDVRTQIIVWQDVDLLSYQGCGIDLVADGNSPGQNRIIAVANNEDLLNLKVPDIFNNRFGSVTYYSAPLETVQITIRFVALADTIRTIAPELATPGSISYVVTSQAANTGDSDLSPGIEQAIEDNVPPTMTVNASDFPVELTARKVGAEVGADLPADLVTATKEFEDPVVACSEDGLGDYGLGQFAPLGLGISNLTCSAAAENGAIGEVNFEVDILDRDDPVLGPMPADQVLEREARLIVRSLSYTLPMATDEIDADVAVVCDIAPDEVGAIRSAGADRNGNKLYCDR